MRQRTKTLWIYAPCCGCRMSVEYDGTGEAWERSTDLPLLCPKGHSLIGQFDGTAFDMQDALHEWLDRRARDGVGDSDERDLCGHDKAER